MKKTSNEFAKSPVSLVLSKDQMIQIILELAERAVGTSYLISFHSAGYVTLKGTGSDYDHLLIDIISRFHGNQDLQQGQI